MTAPTLRIVRRPKGTARRALTAASQAIEDPAKSFRASMAGGSRDDWQSLAWDMLDAVGELRYYTGWRAGSCSRVRLVASDIDPETGLPTGRTDNERVREIVKAIAGGPLGQAQLIKRSVECLTIPGEVWIAILVRPEGELWVPVTREEVKTKANTVTVELPSGEKHDMNLSTDSIFRVWNPRPRRASEADSPVRATLDSLREIVRTTKTISNASKSRLIGNGVVFVPHEMSLPAMNSPVAADHALGATPMLAGTPAVQQLQELLFQVAQTAYDDEDSMAALIPMFAGVPGDQVKNVSHLKFDNSVTDIALKTRNDAIARLAMGLDVSPERLLGLGSNSNHWTAWQLADDDVRLHIAPPIETLCQAINDQVLKVVLEREGIDSTQYVLWYDASVLTADPDKTDEATNAFDRGAITAEAYREFLGLGDSGYDFTTLAGWQAWARDRVSQKPELLQELLPLLDQLDGVIEIAPPPAIAPPPEDDVPPPEEDQADGEPDTEDDTEDVPTGKARLTGQVELAVIELMAGRALELAGKRRRTRADHERLRGVPMHETHRYMTPVAEADIPALIAGWDAALEADTLAMLDMDIDHVRAAVKRLVRERMTRTVVDA